MTSTLLERLRHWIVPPGQPATPAETPAPQEPTGRRDRAPTPSERQLAEAIAQKLLHAWLQNRHQTLMPMSVNLTRFARDDRNRIVTFAAIAATAGNDTGAPSRVSAWLAEAGADAETLATYEAALASPPDLSRALAEVATPDSAGIAYISALVAAQRGEAGSAGQAFADYVARRLMLPNAALRSAQRRYGH